MRECHSVRVLHSVQVSQCPSVTQSPSVTQCPSVTDRSECHHTISECHSVRVLHSVRVSQTAPSVKISESHSVRVLHRPLRVLQCPTVTVSECHSPLKAYPASVARADADCCHHPTPHELLAPTCCSVSKGSGRTDEADTKNDGRLIQGMPECPAGGETPEGRHITADQWRV